MKTNVIDVFDIRDGNGDLIGWYAKGTYSIEEMIKGILFSEGDDFFEEGEEKALKIIHGHMRCVPVSKYDDVPFGFYLIHSPKGRGAFECTTVYRE